jgi:deoxyadenosine/deoxycytidine kinase
LPEQRYVVVEGPVGVGKTTLCGLLANAWKARLVLEEVEENPFLPLFYGNRKAYAFQTQVYFLLSRYRQQQKLGQLDLFSSRVVSDYMFAKDRIFAGINLNEHEFSLYEKLSSVLSKDLVAPDLVVYLQASLDVLLGRIGRRGRPFELDMSKSYLEALLNAYNSFFFKTKGIPVLVVNTDDMDFRNRPGDMEGLLRAIERHRGGMQTYVSRLAE